MTIRRLRRTTVIGIAVLWSFSAQAADRVALVIANSAYQRATTLPNPLQDGAGVAAALREIGFEVAAPPPNLGKDAMLRALRDFSNRAMQAEVAVIYYAGHGMESQGINYLIPVDAELQMERNLPYEAVPLEQAIGAAASARSVRLVIIDACRDNPFAQSMARIDPTRNVNRGMGRLATDSSVHVAYAAAPGAVAKDGPSGGNSPYAAELIRALTGPRLPLDRLLGTVAERVRQATGDQQSPQYSGPSFSRDVFLQADSQPTPQPQPFAPIPSPMAAALQTPAQQQSPAPLQTTAMLAPAAPPPPPPPTPVAAALAVDPAQQALCDAASWPDDRDRPPGVTGTLWAQLRPDGHVIAACEALVRAAPSERRFMATLARLYRKAGRGTEALATAQRAADLGSAAAMNIIGGTYKDGAAGVAKDQTAAFLWYLRGAQTGNPSIMGNLGVMYEEGLGVTQSHAEAVRWYRAGAEAGSGLAMRRLGWMYEMGRGVAQSDAEAIRWYRAGADAGDSYAIRNVGVMYKEGLGVTQNYEEALHWYRAAVEAGDAEALADLGLMYEKGLGVTQSDAEAVRWYRAGAEKQNATAMNNLGWMYRHGRGVTQSDAEAVRWYRPAAEAGNRLAMNRLGFMYENGYGVTRSDTEATRWYRAAAEAGNGTAMNNLGSMHEDGRGVRRDLTEARRWYQQALASEDQEARAVAQENLNRLNGR